MSTPPDTDPTRDAASSRSSGGQVSGSIRSFDDEQLDDDVEAVRERFTYQPPRPGDVDRYGAITAGFRDLGEIIVRTVPAGRERSTALTALSSARMHVNAGIALAGTKGG